MQDAASEQAIDPQTTLRHFGVQGRFGPMTLTFKPLGRHPCAGPEVTDADTWRLTQAEVEEWYVRYNYPRGGALTTRKNGRYCGLFEYQN